MRHVTCIRGEREIYAKTLWMRRHTSNSPFEKPKRRWEDIKGVYAKINRIACYKLDLLG
jgi:hypothetical protein